MARYRVIPTKTQLARLRRERALAREGYILLEQKRQILVVELMELIDRTVDAQEKVEKDLVEAYRALQQAITEMGRWGVYQVCPAVNIQTEIEITLRRVMGVNLPRVTLEMRDHPPYYSLGETAFWVDESVQRFKAILQDLGKLAEMRISLMRLAQEVQKTVRRVNALEKIALPDYQESIKYIEDKLEEMERETFAMLKLVKERLEKQTG